MVYLTREGYRLVLAAAVGVSWMCRFRPTVFDLWLASVRFFHVFGSPLGPLSSFFHFTGWTVFGLDGSARPPERGISACGVFRPSIDWLIWSFDEFRALVLSLYGIRRRQEKTSFFCGVLLRRGGGNHHRCPDSCARLRTSRRALMFHQGGEVIWVSGGGGGDVLLPCNVRCGGTVQPCSMRRGLAARYIDQNVPVQ